MLKWLMIVVMSASFGYADINFHDFLVKIYEKNEKIKVIGVKTTKILELKDGFNAHFITLNIKFIPLDRMFSKNDVVFVRDSIIVSDIINLKTKTSLRNELLGEKVGVILGNLKKGFDENDKNCN